MRWSSIVSGHRFLFRGSTDLGNIESFGKRIQVLHFVFWRFRFLLFDLENWVKIGWPSLSCHNSVLQWARAVLITNFRINGANVHLDSFDLLTGITSSSFSDRPQIAKICEDSFIFKLQFLDNYRIITRLCRKDWHFCKERFKCFILCFPSYLGLENWVQIGLSLLRNIAFHIMVGFLVPVCNNFYTLIWVFLNSSSSH